MHPSVAGVSIKAGYWWSTTACRPAACLDFDENKNDVNKKKSEFNNNNDNH